jgi:flagellar motility protein MotE (MotC chaperone)
MRNLGWKAARLTLITIALSAFGGAAFSVFAGDEPEHGAEHTPSKITKPAEPTEAQAAAKPDPALAGGCLADVSALEDLKRRKAELEAAQKELATKEAELKARERALTDEMAKLAEARDEIAHIEESGKKISEEKVAKLVETIEGMSPKAGSALLSNIDEPLAVAAMTRISTPKLSKLMNVMESSRSTRLSELMAGVVRVKRTKPASTSSIDAAETTVPMPAKPAKGGEKYDGKNNEQASRIPGGSAGAERQPASQRQ